jgi:hypothetical protein
VGFVIRNVLAVLFAHGVRGADPVAEQRPELGDRGIDVEGFRLGRYSHVRSPSVSRLDTLKCGQSQPEETAPCATST